MWRRCTARRILVVDDDPDATDIFSHLLQRMGHDVRGAYNGRHALVAAALFHPEIVFLDLTMPGMDGYEVAKRLRDQQGTPVAIVAVSGWGREEDIARCHEAGFAEHLLKPVGEDALADALARCERVFMDSPPTRLHV